MCLLPRYLPVGNTVGRFYIGTHLCVRTYLPSSSSQIARAHSSWGRRTCCQDHTFHKGHQHRPSRRQATGLGSASSSSWCRGTRTRWARRSPRWCPASWLGSIDGSDAASCDRTCALAIRVDTPLPVSLEAIIRPAGLEWALLYQPGRKRLTEGGRWSRRRTPVEMGRREEKEERMFELVDVPPFVYFLSTCNFMRSAT